MSQVKCECGSVIDTRGLAAHKRGNDHDVNLCLRTQDEEGRAPVAGTYRGWIELAGLPIISGPIRWHNGGINSRGKMTYGYFVQRVIALWIENTKIDGGVRKQALKAIKGLSDTERDELLAAAQASKDLGGSVREFFQKIIVETSCV